MGKICEVSTSGFLGFFKETSQGIISKDDHNLLRCDQAYFDDTMKGINCLILSASEKTGVQYRCKFKNILPQQ